MKLAKIRLADGESRIAALADDDRSLPSARSHPGRQAANAHRYSARARSARTGPLSDRSQGRTDSAHQGDAAGAHRPAGSVGRRRDLQTQPGGPHGRIEIRGRPTTTRSTRPTGRSSFSRRLRGASPARASRCRVRFDSRWSVPEPELALVVSDKQKLVGFTIGNDMSARDIEGENPLYLPQAKLYRQSCALGPCILDSRSAARPRENAASR